MSWKRVVALTAFVSFVWAPLAAPALELITNGGFETGDFTGWTITDQAGSGGSVYIDNADGFTPFSANTTVGPAAGSFYAVSDQGGPATSVLSQAFTVPAGATSVQLSFDMFVNDWSNAGPIDNGLDFNVFPNQHARVDIMSIGAGPFDTGAGVLANLYLTVDAGADPHAHTPYIFDITAAVAGGGSFVLRFAQCGNQFFQNQGIDSVSIDANVCDGDGLIEVGEECDDGNLASGDGCSDDCEVEPCRSCTGEPSSCSALPDGSACDDELFCTGTDTCASGACTVHTGDPCTGGAECNDTCNEAGNNCAAPVSTSCTDDTNECTSDHCDGAGACIHPPSPSLTPCTADTNDCTDDYCDGAGTCVHPDNFNFCDDGEFCNGQDYCFSGSCQGHFGDPCLSFECNTVCDEPTDMCLPSPSGSFCFDDGNICTLDACNGAGACAHPPAPSGGACPSDGLECTDDQCDGAGACAHPPSADTVPCSDDDNECTNDHCDGAGACAHSAVLDGTACDDSDLCTQTDACAAGDCLGSNPVVCSSPACFGPETCDPSSGTCSTCPAGYSQGGGGCQKTYSIDVSLLDNLDSYCDGIGENRYYPGAGQFGFHWTDTGDASVGAVTRVDIALETGVDCDFASHDVTLNGTNVGSYPYANSCFCAPTHTPQLLADVDTSTYVKGGANAVSITATNNTAGLSQDAAGFYAVVTVTYGDPGPQLAVETGCRTSLKSKLKYKNNATNTKDKLGWKWIKGAETSGMEFGDPTNSAEYQLCVFRQTSGAPALLFGADVPASSSWSPLGTSGYKYHESGGGEEGVSKILVKGGAADKSKIIVKGAGESLSDPAVPLAMSTTGILVQLKNESSGVCWESQFPIGQVTHDAAGIKASDP